MRKWLMGLVEYHDPATGEPVLDVTERWSVLGTTQTPVVGEAAIQLALVSEWKTETKTIRDPADIDRYKRLYALQGL